MEDIAVCNIEYGMLIEYKGDIYKALSDGDKFYDIQTNRYVSIATVVTFEAEPIELLEYNDFELKLKLVRK